MNTYIPETSLLVCFLIFIATLAFIMDNAPGMHGEHTKYSDLDIEKLNAFPETALHRNVDVPLIEADKAGFVKTYLIHPGTLSTSFVASL